MPVVRTPPHGQALHAASCHLCCYCGAVTSAGRLDGLGRYRCDDCRDRAQVAAEGSRLAAVQAEVREREAMWGLPSA